MPRRSLVVEFYGGPSIGKSEAMARLFSLLKQRHVSVEMAPEYAKKWAYEGRRIDGLDEFYIFGKQVHAECSLLGKIAVVVTDRPILMSTVYASLYAEDGIRQAITVSADAYLSETYRRHHQRIAILVPRVHAYETTGRFEDEAQAHLVDAVIEQTLGERVAQWLGLYRGVSEEGLRKLADDIEAMTRLV